MIDTKELRQLAQDATPGPWYVRSSNYDVRNIYSANAITDSEGFTFQPVIATVEDIDVPRWRANARLIAAANPAAISGLLDRLEEAEKENIKLREALAEKVTSETVLRALSVGNGSINASFEGGAVHLFVDSLANQFVESGAVNYLEMRFHSEATGPLLLTLQRVNGKTPHQLRTEAEKERDILRAKVAAEI